MLKKVKIYSNKSAKSLEIVDLLMKKLVEKNFDIVEENEIKSFTYELPQVFKYIYDKKVANKENIDLSLEIPIFKRL